MSVHYFIAIPLPESMRDFLAKWQEELKGKLPYKQWPHQQDLHITLKFLGPVADNKLIALKNKLSAIEHHEQFFVNAGGIGTFGNPEKPRVLWAGAEKTEALSRLYEKAEECGVNAGFSKENRVYRPHITLAKKWTGDPAADHIEQIKTDYTDMKTILVNQVVIYQIHPQKSPKYEVIEKYMLKRDD